MWGLSLVSNGTFWIHFKSQLDFMLYEQDEETAGDRSRKVCQQKSILLVQTPAHSSSLFCVCVCTQAELMLGKHSAGQPCP